MSEKSEPEMTTPPPLYPYAGSSGGSGPSEEATRYLDLNGITAASQRAVYQLVSQARYTGFTVKEMLEVIGGHHGRISGAASILHREGHLALLAAKRQKYRVYVKPEFVSVRDTVPHKSNSEKSPESAGEPDWGMVTRTLWTTILYAQTHGINNFASFVKTLETDPATRAKFLRLWNQREGER